MTALLAEPRRQFNLLDFQETRPSYQWPQEAWLPPTGAQRAAPPPSHPPEPPPHPLQRYHDLTTAAWLEDDASGAPGPFDAVDRQSWALARLVCGAALAVGALGMASYLVG